MHWKKRARRAADITVSAVYRLLPSLLLLKRGGHPLTFALAAVGGYKAIAEILESSRPEVWSIPYTAQRAVCQLAIQLEVGDYVNSDESGMITRRVGRLRYGHTGGALQTYVLPAGGTPEDAERFIDLFWAKAGALKIKVSEEYAVDLQPAVARGELPVSGAASDLIEITSRLRGDGRGVGALLLGPPGTGKTTIAMQVAGALGGRTLRAQITTRSTIGGLLDVCKMVRPTCVVLDDLDQGLISGAGFLDLLDDLLELGCSVIATANTELVVHEGDGEDLVRAATRAQRLSIVRRIEAETDTATFEAATEGLSADERNLLRELPLADVKEFMRFRRALGRSAALRHLSAVRARQSPRA